MIRREKQEHLVTTGMIKENACKETARKMYDGLPKRLKVQRVTDALIATGDRDAWKVIIAC